MRISLSYNIITYHWYGISSFVFFLFLLLFFPPGAPYSPEDRGIRPISSPLTSSRTYKTRRPSIRRTFLIQNTIFIYIIYKYYCGFLFEHLGRILFLPPFRQRDFYIIIILYNKIVHAFAPCTAVLVFLYKILFLFLPVNPHKTNNKNNTSFFNVKRKPTRVITPTWPLRRGSKCHEINIGGF